jgi:N utilization substance protein B
MALQALYAMDLTDRWNEEVAEDFYEQDLWPSSAGHARSMLSGVLERKDLIDEAIARHADHWSVPRMNLIDRNLLRIAVYELRYCGDIPLKVSINEAIELGKLYGTRETKRFLNGVLDRIARHPRAKTSEP